MKWSRLFGPRNMSFGPEPIVTYPADNPRSTYLVPDDGLEPDLAKLLDEFWEDVFESELSMWMVGEDTWPQARTREMFDEWFDAEVADTVVDLVPEEPLSQNDVEKADIEYALNHCAWCDLEVETETRRVVGLSMPFRQAFAFREGLTIAVPVSDRFITGIMTTADSPAAVEGQDAMFAPAAAGARRSFGRKPNADSSA